MLLSAAFGTALCQCRKVTPIVEEHRHGVWHHDTWMGNHTHQFSNSAGLSRLGKPCPSKPPGYCSRWTIWSEAGVAKMVTAILLLVVLSLGSCISPGPRTLISNPRFPQSQQSRLNISWDIWPLNRSLWEGVELDFGPCLVFLRMAKSNLASPGLSSGLVPLALKNCAWPECTVLFLIQASTNHDLSDKNFQVSLGGGLNLQFLPTSIGKTLSSSRSCSGGIADSS